MLSPAVSPPAIETERARMANIDGINASQATRCLCITS
jgi:hypothetical protein